MKENPLKILGELGQSVWLDYIRRDLITGDGLQQMIEKDGLRGMTSNPAIFEKAISGSHLYDEDIWIMGNEGKNPKEIYEAITQRDVRDAADEFRHIYSKTDFKDGYVSLEVNPHLAHDTTGTISEARCLWSQLNRPNIYIKVPATRAGLESVRQLITDGLNINVTLLFGLSRYRQVAQAYVDGLEERFSQGMSLKNVSSVASFFVSRIDMIVDPILEKIIEDGGEMAEIAKKAHGQVAISSAKSAYQIYKSIFNSDHFKKLAVNGARPQRLLWASTGTKNLNYSDVKYIDALIGENTVNTIPVTTMDSYRDHGSPALRIEEGVEEALEILDQLPALGIDIDKITQQLEDEGIENFNMMFDKLLDALGGAYGR
ncbi:MAG: transaldolase [Saccharofermentanales bacterium]